MEKYGTKFAWSAKGVWIKKQSPNGLIVNLFLDSDEIDAIIAMQNNAKR